MIADIVQGMAMMILPITLVVAILLYMSEIYNRRIDNIYKQLKALICILFTIAIVVSTLIILVFDTYNVALMLEEAEIVSYEVRELLFTCVTILWNIIGAVLIFNIWKHIYYTNYNIINDLKNDWKKIKERKSHGRYEETNKL